MTCNCDKCQPTTQEEIEKRVIDLTNEYFDRYEISDNIAEDIMYSINRKLKTYFGLPATKNVILSMEHEIIQIFYNYLQRNLIQRKSNEN